MSDLDLTVTRLLRAAAGGRRLRLGVLCRGDLALVEAVIAEGHPSLVLGDRFRQLFALHRRLERIGFRSVLVVEAFFDAPPVARRSLDALILSGGLPSGSSPVLTLARLRGLLTPGGLLIWPHPTTEGTRGRLGRVLVPARRGVAPPAGRHRFCAWAMEAGYRAVRQHSTRGGPVPWVVTSGIAGTLGW
jgi:hypothetical protein